MQREKSSLFSALAYLIEYTMPGRFVSINVRKCVWNDGSLQPSDMAVSSQGFDLTVSQKYQVCYEEYSNYHFTCSSKDQNVKVTGLLGTTTQIWTQWKCYGLTAAITWLKTHDVWGNDSVNVMSILTYDIRTLMMDTESISETYVSIIRLVTFDTILAMTLQSGSETMVDLNLLM